MIFSVKIQSHFWLKKIYLPKLFLAQKFKIYLFLQSNKKNIILAGKFKIPQIEILFENGETMRQQQEDLDPKLFFVSLCWLGILWV